MGIKCLQFLIFYLALQDIWFVNICNNITQNIKDLQKNAVNKNVRLIRSIDMYTMWPGCYSFRDELKLFAMWFKEQSESLILKIYEIDRLLNI